MKLVIGLGNIGKNYEGTRHNVGFMCLEHWAKKHNLTFRTNQLYDFIQYKNAALIKPKTFMNRSGLALKEAYLKWNCSEALVVHDDIELPLATLRVRYGGGDGGHKGIKSLLEIFPPDNLKRIRIGIGRGEENPQDYVLDKFTQDELSSLMPSLELACDFIDIYIDKDFNAVLDAYSIWKKTCSEKIVLGNESPKEK